tara:strand:- start:327 stop:542 length:216 start_codon:yes stop_codon:yes gene_type:complete
MYKINQLIKILIRTNCNIVKNNKEKIIRNERIIKNEKIIKNKEINGPTKNGKYLEPTRFGDWEKKGRISDF